MTIHDFDLARFITGTEVVEVFATGAVMVDPAIGEVGDVDTAVVVLRHQSGCDDGHRQLPAVRLWLRPAGGGVRRPPAWRSSENPPGGRPCAGMPPGHHRPPIPTFFLDRYADSYLSTSGRPFVAAVAAGQPAPVTGADGRIALVLGLAARRSMVEGRPVEP